MKWKDTGKKDGLTNLSRIGHTEGKRNTDIGKKNYLEKLWEQGRHSKEMWPEDKSNREGIGKKDGLENLSRIGHTEGKRNRDDTGNKDAKKIYYSSGILKTR